MQVKRQSKWVAFHGRWKRSIVCLFEKLCGNAVQTYVFLGLGRWLSEEEQCWLRMH